MNIVHCAHCALCTMFFGVLQGIYFSKKDAQRKITKSGSPQPSLPSGGKGEEETNESYKYD